MVAQDRQWPAVVTGRDRHRLPKQRRPGSLGEREEPGPRQTAASAKLPLLKSSIA